jgi:hypothetical protein
VIAAVAPLWSLHVARFQNRRHLIASQFMVTVGLDESDRLYEFDEALLVLLKAKLEARIWSAWWHSATTRSGVLVRQSCF